MNRLVLLLPALLLAVSPVTASGGHGSHSSPGSRSHRSGGSHSSSGTGHHRASGHVRAGPHAGGHPSSHPHHRGHDGKRDPEERARFMRSHPCPSTGKTHGACPGYVVDHVQALKHGGADVPSNMQWQSVEEAKGKDRWE